MVELILVRGLPGSGKSTKAKELAKEKNYVHLETDGYFVQNGEYKFDATRLGVNHKRCQEDALTFLKAGKSVVVSNTFTQLWEMKPYLDAGYPITVIAMHTQYKNIHDVPEASLNKMKKRWETYDGETIIQ